jgi:lipid-binding SYLF domain-containing protein
MTLIRRPGVWLGLSTLLLVASAQLALAQSATKAAQNRTEIDAESATVLKEFLARPGGQALYDKAAGYATFKVTKAGFGASGAGGGGVAVDKQTGMRTYMRMGAAGVGFTVGVSRYDVVILFETDEKFAAFSQGGWDSTATVQATAGTAAAELSSTFFNGVAYFQFGRKGLLASADVSGTRFWVADELNRH